MVLHCQGSGTKKSIRRQALATGRPCQQALEQRQAACARDREVDMRVGAIGDQRIAERHHGLGDVGVQVECGHDRQIRGDSPQSGAAARLRHRAGAR